VRRAKGWLFSGLEKRRVAGRVALPGGSNRGVLAQVRAVHAEQETPKPYCLRALHFLPLMCHNTLLEQYKLFLNRHSSPLPATSRSFSPKMLDRLAKYRTMSRPGLKVSSMYLPSFYNCLRHASHVKRHFFPILNISNFLFAVLCLPGTLLTPSREVT
jgi:hypothetical protein